MDYTVHGILQARILEWVAVPFFRESSQPKDRTQVSHFAGEFFTSWVTKEGPVLISACLLHGQKGIEDKNSELRLGQTQALILVLPVVGSMAFGKLLTPDFLLCKTGIILSTSESGHDD